MSQILTAEHFGGNKRVYRAVCRGVRKILGLYLCDDQNLRKPLTIADFVRALDQFPDVKAFTKDARTQNLGLQSVSMIEVAYDRITTELAEIAPIASDTIEVSCEEFALLVEAAEYATLVASALFKLVNEKDLAAWSELICKHRAMLTTSDGAKSMEQPVDEGDGVWMASSTQG